MCDGFGQAIVEEQMSETPFRKAEDGSYWVLDAVGAGVCVKSSPESSWSPGHVIPLRPGGKAIKGFSPAHLEIKEKETPFRAGDRFVDKAGVKTTLVSLDDDRYALGQKGLLHENFTVHPLSSNWESFRVIR